MKIKKEQFKTLIRGIICEALQQLNESQNGEWWIYPGGQAVFADGDVGDSNHEGYVIQHVSSEIYEHFLGIPDDAIGYLSEYENDLLEALKNEDRLSEEDIEMWNTSGPTEVLIEKLLEDKMYPDREQTEFAVYIAWGASSKDARDYAMRYLGWKRMTTSTRLGTDIQTWFLRESDLRDIKRGIFDAWSDYSEEEDDTKHEVTIEVRASNKTYSNIPLEELERATVNDLSVHIRGSSWMRQ